MSDCMPVFIIAVVAHQATMQKDVVHLMHQMASHDFFQILFINAG